MISRREFFERITAALIAASVPQLQAHAGSEVFDDRLVKNLRVSFSDGTFLNFRGQIAYEHLGEVGVHPVNALGIPWKQGVWIPPDQIEILGEDAMKKLDKENWIVEAAA
jgi:hypothetical protein